MGAGLRREAYRRLLEELAVWERWGGLPGGLVLDYGCGRGWFLERLGTRGFRVVGVEVQPGFLAEANRRAKVWGGLAVLYGGGTVPLKDGSVDMILAIGVIRSLMDRGPLEEAVGEWRRCLRVPGRLLVIETDNAALRRHLGIEGIRKTLERAGFEALAWYPIRKPGCWGLGLVKVGLWPRSLYRWMAGWELKRRRRSCWGQRGKLAYLGEFRKGEW